MAKGVIGEAGQPEASSATGGLTLPRSRHYLTAGFDRVYDGRLRELSSGPLWVEGVEALQEPALEALRGETDLQIAQLAEVYEALRSEAQPWPVLLTDVLLLEAVEPPEVGTVVVGDPGPTGAGRPDGAVAARLERGIRVPLRTRPRSALAV